MNPPGQYPPGLIITSQHTHNKQSPPTIYSIYGHSEGRHTGASCERSHSQGNSWMKLWPQRWRMWMILHIVEEWDWILMSWITYLVGVLITCCASVVMWWLLESGNGEEKRAYLYSSSRKAFQSETVVDVLWCCGWHGESGGVSVRDILVMAKAEDEGRRRRGMIVYMFRYFFFEWWGWTKESFTPVLPHGPRRGRWGLWMCWCGLKNYYFRFIQNMSSCWTKSLFVQSFSGHVITHNSVSSTQLNCNPCLIYCRCCREIFIAKLS